MANLFSISNGKITYNDVSNEELEKKSKKSNLKQLKNNYKETQKQVKMVTNNIGTYLNKNGQNVNINAPLQANVISNSQINKSKNSLSGRVTLEDVVQEHSNLLNNTETGQELKNNLRSAKNENAWAGYNYNKAKVDSEKTTLADKTIGNITRGIADLTSNMGDSRDVIDANGKKIKLPSYSELKQQKVSESYNTGIGKFFGDATYNISKIGTSSLLNIPTLGVGGSAVYWSDMYFDSLNSAKNEGYEDKNATIYAMINTSLEFLTGKLLGTATSKLTGGASNELSNAIANGVNKLISNPKIANIIGNAGSEATEEFIQEYLDNINKLVTLEGSKNPKDYIDVLSSTDILKDAIYSAGIGALSGGFFGEIDSSNEVKNTQYNVNLLNSYKEQLEETKKSVTNTDTINKIDTIISNIDNQINNTNTTISQINEFQELQKQNKLTKNQEVELKKLQEQLKNIQKQTQNIDNITNVDENNSKQYSVPTVQDIVNMENRQSSNLDLPIFNNSNSNVELSLKEQQNSVIQNSNPVGDDYHTWIRSTDDIKTFEETLNDSDYKEYFDAGEDFDETYTAEMARKALETGKITVYSSYPIEQGTFVSPSKMEAESYSGNGKLYSKEVSLTDVAWIDPTQGQYAKVSTKIAPVIDTTSVNNTNTALAPVDVSQIKQTKGNIPINQELLNKYSTAKEIFDNEGNNFDGKVNVETNIPELNDIDISTLKSKETKELAYEIFKKYNLKSVFENDGNKITVSKSGINESVEKIFNNKEQRNLLKEHLQVFSDLGDIIEHATLVNQTREVKNRENINSWNYYFDGLNIDGEIYHLEFDVRSLHNGQNQYRVQRLQKKQTTHSGDLSNITNDLPAFGQSAFSENNIPQSNINVKSDILPTINNMQNNENNTNNLAPTKEYFENKNINEQSEKLAEILKEKPLMEDNKDGWLKKLATIKFIDKGYYVDKLARKTKNSELSSKYDYSLTANGIANHIIGNGRYDEKGNKIGKGLYEIFEPIENSDLLDDFSSYVYHKHNVDRMNLQNRYNEANKAVFGDGMTSEMSEQKVKEYESKYPEFETWANDIYEYNNANLEMLVKYGVISNEDMDYYNKKYPHYVPTIRQNSKQKTQMDFLLGKKASVNNPIKTAKGGNGDIIPLKDAMALRTMQTVNSSLRNNFGLELLNTVETEQIRNKENIDNIVEDINMEELITKGDKTKSATLTVFENGEKITFDISDEIYEALKPSNIYTVKWLNKFNNFRRGLLTEYNPTFMITNPIKDIQDGSINSKHPDAFAKNIIEAAKQIKNKGQYYQLYMANGGSYETYFNYNTGTNIVPSKIDKIAPLRKISEINEVIEMTPRLSEFISSIEAGESVETAMYNANEITTNFKRGGDITKTLDRNGVTFLNAGVQGTVKQIRNVQEARTAGIKGITKLAVRWTIAGLIPTLLMNMIWDDDDDYEELSDYVKNNYYIIGKYGDGKFIRIPKGRVTSVLQSFFQNMINGVNGKELDLDGFIDLIENNLLPNNPEENNLLSPLVQAHNNTTWYGGTLVPTRLQNLPNAEQYDESIDSISIWLGKQLNISPYKINYVLDQYSGAIGDYILPYLTQEAESGSDSFTGKLIAPVKDKFTVDSTLKNQNISDFYSLSEELTKKSNSSKATDEDILKNKYINSIKSDISKLYAEKRKIQSSSLKDSEKYNQSKEIQKEINELSKNALKDYKEVVSYGNYGKVFENEYYLNSKNEWTKVDDDEKEEIAKLKMSDSEKNEYFKTKVEVGIIKSNEDKTSKEKKEEIAEIVINSNLSDENKGYLYSKYYSSKETIDTILKSKISIDEFIKFNSQTFESDYYDNGKTVSNSRKKKVINYINSLNLSVAQKAILIKMEYSSYNSYNSQIVNYINKMDYSKYEKACILKQIGFDDYDSYIIETVNKKKISISEKVKILEDLGFKIRNGKVYSK